MKTRDLRKIIYRKLRSRKEKKRSGYYGIIILIFGLVSIGIGIVAILSWIF